MKNLFALIGISTVAFAGFGWYLDWYSVSQQPSASGTQSIKFDLHGNKIADDVQTGFERGSDMVKQFQENNKPDTSTKAPASTPPTGDNQNANPTTPKSEPMKKQPLVPLQP